MFKKILITAKWALINGFFTWCAYLWIFEGRAWAENVFKFGVWISLVVTVIVMLVFAASKETQQAYRESYHVNPYVNVIYDIVMSLFVASAGSFGYAAMIFTQGTLQFIMGVYKKEEKVDAVVSDN